MRNQEEYNKQIPCHVVGFVANICFLLGITLTFAFFDFWLLFSIFLMLVEMLQTAL
jgi:hypothetical protein